jgi:hypothetical protein
VLFYKIWNGRAKPKMPAMNADIMRADVWRVIHDVKTLRKVVRPVVSARAAPALP